MSIQFDGKVAIVTGAGAGLGRQHALALAARGATVVVNDFGGNVDGTGGSSAAALAVVDEIQRAGGAAVANGANVANAAQVRVMVEDVITRFGRVDILINNAGILRDKSFSKMDAADFTAVLDVHVMGAVNCTKAVWEVMRTQQYGRIVMTTSAAGLYGNFGQANYATAKMALVGLMNALHQEGIKSNIRVNAIAPIAATRMTEELLPANMLAAIQPECVTPGVLYLCSEQAPSRTILSAGGGAFAVATVVESAPVHLDGDALSPEGVAACFSELADLGAVHRYEAAGEEVRRFIQTALAAEV